jgi:hypothetical protein
MSSVTVSGREDMTGGRSSSVLDMVHLVLPDEIQIKAHPTIDQ